MDEDLLEPDLEYWEWDSDYVEEEPRGLAGWKYEGEHDFDTDLRVRLNAERDGYLFIPPHQFYASEPRTYGDLDEAYEEAVQYVHDFDVEQLGDLEGDRSGQ